MTTASKKKTKKKKKVASRTGKSTPAKKAKPPKPEKPDITDQQRLFADHYIAEPNGAKAAVAAGYAKKSARIQASYLLTIPNIRAYVDKGWKEKRVELRLQGNHLLQAIEDIVMVTSDPDHPKFKPAAALKGCFYLGRQQQMEFATEKHEVVSHGDIAQDILDGRKRAAERRRPGSRKRTKA